MFRRSARLPLLPLGFLAVAFLCGCGDDPVGPFPGPGLPRLSGVIEPPAGFWLQYPHDVAVAPDGRLFIRDIDVNADDLPARLVVLTTGGEFVREFPLDGERYAVSSDRVYVVQSWRERVEVYDHAGAHLYGFGFAAAEPVDFPFGFDIAASPGGRAYVLDPALRRVQGFSPAGQLEVVWGERGTGPGQMEYPARIDVDAQGNVYVLDVDLWRVQKFTPDGGLLAVWDLAHSVQFGAFLDGDFAVDGRGRPVVLDQSFSPGRVTVLAAGGGEALSWLLPDDDAGACVWYDAIATRGEDELLLVCSRRDQLVRFSTTGERLGTIGRPYGSEPGELVAIGALAAGPAGGVVVLDDRSDRVERYAADGGYLGPWPLPPHGGDVLMATTPAGDLWLVQRYGSGRVVQVSPDGTIRHEWNLVPGSDTAEATFLPSPRPGRATAIDMDVDPLGGLVFLVPDAGSGYRIEHRSPDGELIRDLKVPGEPGKLVDMAVAPDWRVWLLPYAGNPRIVSLLTGAVEEFEGLDRVPDGVDGQLRIAFDGPGNMYLLAARPARVLLFDRAGGFAGEFGRTDLVAEDAYYYRQPFAVSSSGSVWVAATARKVLIYHP